MASSSVAWRKHSKKSLSTPLINSTLDEDDFIRCIEPLRYILFPIGIYHLFPDYKPNMLQQIWSYVFAISLLAINVYSLNPAIDGWLTSVDQNHNEAQKIALRLCFIDHQLTSIIAYAYVRFYFIRKQKFIKLLRTLYQYIQNSCVQIKSTKDTSEYSQKFYMEIHNFTKSLSILCYALQISLAIAYTAIAIVAINTNNYFSYMMSWVFIFQVYWVMFAIRVTFLIVLKILRMYYFVYKSKIYHCYIAGNMVNGDSKDILKILDMDEIENVFDDGSDTNNMGIQMTAKDDMVVWSLADMKTEYIQMMRLWAKNAKYWDWIFPIASASICFQILQGFIFFFTVDRVSFFVSAFLLWLWGFIGVIMYLSQLPKMNTTTDDLKELVVVIDDGSSENEIRLMKFIQFIDIHRCSFVMLGVEINWNLTYALVVTSVSPLFTYLLSYFISSASF